MPDKIEEEPRAGTSHDISLDKEYAQWIYDIKQRFRSAQIKAAVKVNSEQLLFNWQLGRDLVIRKAEEKNGDAALLNRSVLIFRLSFRRQRGSQPETYGL